MKIRDKVKTIRLVNPLQFKVISESAKKTDEEEDKGTRRRGADEYNKDEGEVSEVQKFVEEEDS